MNARRKCVLVILMLLNFLVGCSNDLSSEEGSSTLFSKSPSEQELIAMVPTNITSYVLDDCSYTSEVIDLEMEKGIETETGYDAYCKIMLDDGNMCRIVYYIFHCQKDKGTPWYLLYYDTYGDEEITCIKCGPALNVIRDVEGLEPISQINDISKYTDNSFTYEANLDNTYTYFSCSGTVIIEGYLVKNSGDSYEYEWVIYSNTENMKYDLSYLEGEWLASGSTNTYIEDCCIYIWDVNEDTQEITLSLYSSEDDEMYAEDTCYYDFDGINSSFSFEVSRGDGKNPYLFNVYFQGIDYRIEGIDYLGSDWKYVTVDDYEMSSISWSFREFEKIQDY